MTHTNKRVLAVDPGSVEIGLFDGKRGTTLSVDPKMPRPERLAALGELFKQHLQNNDVFDFVVYEEQFVRGGAATKALFGIVGIIEATSINMGTGVMSVPQSTTNKWKKARLEEETGCKPPKKSKLLNELVSQTYGSKVSTEHEHDAACIWHYINETGVING